VINPSGLAGTKYVEVCNDASQSSSAGGDKDKNVDLSFTDALWPTQYGSWLERRELVDLDERS
jgi:hypothetical protein